MVPRLICTLELPGEFQISQRTESYPRDGDLIGLGCTWALPSLRSPETLVGREVQEPPWRLGLSSPTAAVMCRALPTSAFLWLQCCACHEVRESKGFLWFCEHIHSAQNLFSYHWIQYVERETETDSPLSLFSELRGSDIVDVEVSRGLLHWTLSPDSCCLSQVCPGRLTLEKLILLLSRLGSDFDSF